MKTRDSCTVTKRLQAQKQSERESKAITAS